MDTGLDAGDDPLLLPPAHPLTSPSSSSSSSVSSELSLPPGLGGLNLSGNLGFLNHSHMHHVNPLSLSMGAEDDMGVRYGFKFYFVLLLKFIVFNSLCNT